MSFGKPWADLRVDHCAFCFCGKTQNPYLTHWSIFVQGEGEGRRATEGEEGEKRSSDSLLFWAIQRLPFHHSRIYLFCSLFLLEHKRCKYFIRSVDVFFLCLAVVEVPVNRNISKIQVQESERCTTVRRVYHYTLCSMLAQRVWLLLTHSKGRVKVDPSDEKEWDEKGKEGGE